MFITKKRFNDLVDVVRLQSEMIIKLQNENKRRDEILAKVIDKNNQIEKKLSNDGK